MRQKVFAKRIANHLRRTSTTREGELLNGKIANKTVDKLLYYAGKLGLEAKAKFVQARKVAVEKGLALAD